MAEVNIPDEAVKAAVLGAKNARDEIGRAVKGSDGNHGVSADEVFRLEALRSLEAAAPLIVAAELERLSHELIGEENANRLWRSFLQRAAELRGAV